MNDFDPRIVVYCCKYCSYTAADTAGCLRLQYPPNIHIIQVPCTGRVDILHILRPIEEGADGVFVAACLDGDCHFLTGNVQARKRVEYVKRTLEEIGMEPERVGIYNISAGQGHRFAEIAHEITTKIKELGPSPIHGRDK
nr:hydrogenase iron-sulfur subunit [Desulfobacterales bacterium]